MLRSSQTAPPAAMRPQNDDISAPATQIVRDRDAYLGQNRDIGRRLTDDQVELFVAEEPATALQRELDRLKPQYIALHDVGTAASLRLLKAMAANTGGKLMRLAVRRQGHGMALATLQFVEITGSDGSRLRVYSTDIDADSHGRHLMARTLLAHARLSVLVFGDLPSHALAAAVQPLIDSLAHENWPNRHMLMVPLGAQGSLNRYAAAFAEAGIHPQVAGQVARATDAWSVIGATWNQLDGVTADAATSTPTPPAAVDDSEAPTQPMGLAADKPASKAQRGGVNWFDYVQRCASLKGMVSCCVFDRSDGHALAHAGARPPAEVMQALGERLLATASDVGAMLGTGTDVLELGFSTASHHVLLRALPRHPGVVLHAVLDGITGNPTLARAQLARLDPG